MDIRSVRGDLDFLVKNPKKTLASTYHDAGSCWLLIDAALREIRTLRKNLAEERDKRTSQKKRRH